MLNVIIVLTTLITNSVVLIVRAESTVVLAARHATRKERFKEKIEQMDIEVSNRI